MVPFLSRRSGLRLARISTIDLVADWSLLVIFALVVVQLGAGAFPAWHPDWSPLISWTTALAAGILFFASIAVHELAHAVVAQRVGIPIHRITLFLFGGVAQMEREPESARAEFAMAIVGPITSLAIGFLAILAGSALVAPDVASGATMTEVIAGANPLATLLLWLGPVNILLGIFNLLPGFPLDGGRVLRAALWGATRDLVRATRWAAGVGQAFAWLLMAAGIALLFGATLPWIGSGPIAGLWLLLIGWFLANAARASYQRLIIRRAFGHVRVAEIMRQDIRLVSPDIPIAQLVDEIRPGAPSAYPVVAGDSLVGVVELEGLRAGLKTGRPDLRVGDVMVPRRELEPMTPDDEAAQAFDSLGRKEVVPVLGSSGRVQGLLGRDDLIRWLALHSEASFA